MKSFFLRLNLKQRLRLLLSVPLFGLLAFLGVSMLNHTKEVNESKRSLESIKELSELATTIRSNVDSWQNERLHAISALTLAGRVSGDKIKPEVLDKDRYVKPWRDSVALYERQFIGTDLSVKEFRDKVSEYDFSKYGEGFTKVINNALSAIDTMNDERKYFSVLGEDALKLGSDRPIVAGSGYIRYSNLNESLIRVVDQIAALTEDIELYNLILSYGGIIRAKEEESKIQSILYTTFDQGGYTGVFFTRVCKSDQSLKNALAYYNRFATRENTAYLIDAMPEELDATYADYLRKAQRANGAMIARSGISLEDWMSVSTDRLDILRSVEDELSDQLIASVDKIKQAASSEFYWLLGFSGFIIVASIALSTWISGSTISRITNFVVQLSQGSQKVSDASNVVASSSSAIASSAEEQAASMGETASSLDRINDLMLRNTELSGDASKATQDAASKTNQCLHQMEQMNEAMGEISSSSGAISAIIKIIDEIAFQTNILALNAAVEAARAGEAGAGFAVVADEVRGLAQRSAQAASDSSKKIKDSIDKSRKGEEICQLVDGSLREIVGQVGSIDEMVGHIASASEKQKESLSAINLAIKEQERGISEVTASSEETAVSADELEHQSKLMRQSVMDLAELSGVNAAKLEAIVAEIQSSCGSYSQPVGANAFDGFGSAHARQESPQLFN